MTHTSRFVFVFLAIFVLGSCVCSVHGQITVSGSFFDTTLNVRGESDILNLASTPSNKIILDITGGTWTTDLQNVAADRGKIISVITSNIASGNVSPQQAAGWAATVTALDDSSRGALCSAVRENSNTRVTLTFTSGISGYALTARGDGSAGSSEVLTIGMIPSTLTSLGNAATMQAASGFGLSVSIQATPRLAITASAFMSTTTIMASSLQSASSLTIILNLTGATFVDATTATLKGHFLQAITSNVRQTDQPAAWATLVSSATTATVGAFVSSAARSNSNQRMTVTLGTISGYNLTPLGTSTLETLTFTTLPAASLSTVIGTVTATGQTTQVISAVPSLQVSGTFSTVSELQIRPGGLTIILSVVGDSFKAVDSSSASYLASSLVSAQSEINGWNAVKTSISQSNIVLLSSTSLSVTLPALSTYTITASETITITVAYSLLTNTVSNPPALATKLTITDVGDSVVIASVTDANNYATDGNGHATIQLSSPSNFFQTFTASASRFITRIGLKPIFPGRASLAIQYRIYNGVGTAGTVLATSSTVIVVSDGQNSFLTAKFSPVVSITNGQTYSVGIIYGSVTANLGFGSSSSLAFRVAGSVYSGGRLGPTGNSAYPDTDLMMLIYMENSS